MKLWLTRQNGIKFIVATAAFYALLAINVFRVGEIIAPAEKDYLNNTHQAESVITTTWDQYIQDAMQEIQNAQIHGAANETGQTQSKFQTICSSNKTLCNKIEFAGTYTEKEKFLYLSSIFKIAMFINDNLITQQQTEDTLADIAVNKNTGNRRWYATRDTVVLNLWSVQNSKEFLGLVSHELGHILDLGMLQGSDGTTDDLYTEFGKSVFALDDISIKYYGISRDNETIRRSTATKKDFCSGYGMSDPFEDLAECFNLYTHNNALFKTFASSNNVMKKKFNFIASLFDGTYLSKWTTTLTASDRPRDTTRIN